MSEELSNKYIVCIGNDGFEALFEITGLAEEETFAKLTGKESRKLEECSSFLSAMRMRIRMNFHRDIKSYVITIDEDECTFRNMLCEDKDNLCNYIRENHTPMKRL